MTKQEFTNLLRDNFCTVVFQKKSGEVRTMHCTLQQMYIEQNALAPKGAGNPSPETLVKCIDTEINEWRSFNVNSVLDFKVG